MNWYHISLGFLTGCVVGNAWMLINLSRAHVRLAAQHEREMIAITRALTILMERVFLKDDELVTLLRLAKEKKTL